MSKGTILYTGGFELPDKNAAAHRVLSVGKVLRDLGYNVVFIGIDKSLPFDADVSTTKTIVQGFECWAVPYPKKTYEWLKYLSSVSYMNVMKEVYTNIEGLIAYNYPAMGLHNLRKYGNAHNFKVMADCTEWYSTRGTNIIFKIIKGLDSFLRMRVIHKKMDGLIVISKYLENYYENCKNVVRIPPLVDIEESKWRFDLGEKDNSDLDDSKINFVYSGTPGKNKDQITTIIDAFIELKDFDNFQLDIIGIEKRQLVKDYPSYCEKLEILGSRINFIGKIPHEDSLQKLIRADYSIFIREKTRLTTAGFPTKFVESVTCSTPVITSDSSDIAEYFSDLNSGYLLKNNTAECLKDVLIDILLNKSKESKSIKKQCNSLFHYKQYLEEISKLMSHL